MRGRLPSMPFFVSDYLGSAKVRMMSLAARGAYCQLLFFQWQEGRLVNCSKNLARLCDCTEIEFSDIWPEISGQFVSDGNGQIYNRKVEEVRKEYVSLRKKRKQAGSKGGSKGVSKRQANAKQKSTSSPILSYPVLDPSSKDHKKKNKNLSKSPSGTWTGWLEFWEAYPRKEDKKESFRLWNREKPDLGEVLEWLAEAKESEQWQDKSKIPLPSTFLNRRRWEADPPPKPKINQGETLAELEARLDAYGASH